MPIVGDEKYGDTVFNSTMKNFGVKRMFLHASKLKFKHPNQSFLIDVMSPLPDDLKIIIDKLNANELPEIKLSLSFLIGMGPFATPLR